MQFRRLLVIGGPTACGKTAAAIHLAQKYKTEIINADSRQFYREMKIGTAMPDEEELKQATHHFVGHLSVTDKFTAGMFEHDVLILLEKLFQKHETVILSGGSGLFIKAVCEGFDELPSSEIIRKKLNQLSLLELQTVLKEKDAEYFSIVDIYNPRRLQRALEVIEISGKKYSELRKQNPKKRNFQIEKYLIHKEKEELHSRINARVNQMIEKGLVEEVKKLYPFKDLNTLQTVGYTEMFEYLDGKCSLDKAIENIKIHTRQYAKRQTTWFQKENMKRISLEELMRV